MTDSNGIDDDLIQAYIDDRLDDQDRARVAAHLLAHPDVAADVERVRQQNEALRGIGQEILDEPVPEKLRAILNPPFDIHPVTPMSYPPVKRRSHFLEAAAAVLLFVVGAIVGWYGHGVLRPAPSDDDLAIAGIVRAFTDFGADRQFPIEFPPDRNLELASWISRSFNRTIEAPNLVGFDYAYVGGRLLPGTHGRTGAFLFENADGGRLATFFWHRPAPPKKVIEISRRDGTETRFWFGDGFGFAVVSESDDGTIDRVATAVFDHYERSLQRH